MQGQLTDKLKFCEKLVPNIIENISQSDLFERHGWIKKNNFHVTMYLRTLISHRQFTDMLVCENVVPRCFNIISPEESLEEGHRVKTSTPMY